MAKRNLHLCAVLMLAACVAGAAHAQQKTIADKSAEADVTLELLQKQRQINDMLVTDPILKQLPTVVSVLVLQGKRTARLAMPSGVVQTFEEGDEIAERMHLRSVSVRMVRVLIQPLANAKSKAPVSVPLQFMAARNQGTGAGGVGIPGAMAPNQQPGMPAAPLAIPPGLIQAQPSLQFGVGPAGQAVPPGQGSPSQTPANGQPAP